MAVLPLAGPGAGADQGPGTAPDTFTAAKRDVLKGDRFAITCGGATTENNGTAIIFFVFTNRTTHSVNGGQGWALFGTTQASFRVEAGDTPIVDQAAATFDAVALASPEWAGTIRSEGRLRVVWASWGTPFDCAIVVNGYEIDGVPLEKAKGVQARLHDFSGTASADTDVFGAGAQLKFTRENLDGFVYSWFWASGSVTNRGPDGQSAQNKNYFWPGIVKGTWTYKMTYGYEIESPRAFLLETPV